MPERDSFESIRRQFAALNAEGKFAANAEWLGELVAASPEDGSIRILYALALTLVEEGRGRAADEAHKAVALNGRDPWTLMTAANVLYQEGEYLAAEEYVRRVSDEVTLSEFRYGPDLVNIAGRLAEKRGDMQRAEALLRGAFEARPDQWDFGRDLARFYHRRGQRAEAREVALAVLRIRPGENEMTALTT
jgi:tetratricopeptide (TPR) repeat protein